MTMQNDLLSDAQLFTTLMSLEMTDRDRSPRGSWKSDTRLEVLAHERLTNDGVPVLGTGPARAALPLSLLVHLPL